MNDHHNQRNASEDAGDRFLRRVQRATMHVLGDSDTGRNVLALCEEHRESRQQILIDRNSGATVVAVVGATGQGKSWLIRNLVRRSGVAQSIRSGNNLDEATEKLTWIGPRPPMDLDLRHERYLPCSESDMETVGVPYVLVDAPGSTDERRSIAMVAQRALSMASVIVLVVRRDQIRSQAVAMLTQASEGSLVIPVINAVRTRDVELDGDIDMLMSKLRNAAGASTFAPPVMIDDFDIGDRNEGRVGESAALTVVERIREQLLDGWDGDRRKSTRLAAVDGRFRSALHAILQEHLPGLTSAVVHLNQETLNLPSQVAQSMVGSGGPLRAVIRSRLRAALLSEIPAICFPFRSLLGLLNLTHGAWDRVALSLSGSLPSLISAAWTTAQNLKAGYSAQDTVQDGLRQRSAAAVADRLMPLARRFREELAELRNERVARLATVLEDDETKPQMAFLAGLDTLQERSQSIFERQIDAVAVSRRAASIAGIAGTLLFWVFLSGPIVGLYREYFAASVATLSAAGGDLDAYPHPQLSTMLTSLSLSLLPLSILAMAVMTWAQSFSRVEQAEERITQLHQDEIARLQRDGVLTLRWDDPLLTDAEFLLSAGTENRESEFV